MMEQISFFPEDENNGIESVVSDKKTPRNYGIQKKHLNYLGYDDLRDIFFGMHNIDTPHEMLVMLNPAEILSIYMAVGAIKRSSSQHNDFITRFDNIEELVREFNRITYTGSNLASIKRDAPNPHSDKPGDQKKRIYSLDDEVKRRFIESFKQPYFGSIQEGYYGKGEYPDPAYEGADKPFSKNKKVYSNKIFTLIEGMYERNTGKR